jgi:UDP-glucose 4-epimerase
VFNVGGTEPITHRDLVDLLIDVAGTGRVTYVPWPPEKKQIDIGSFYSDSSKFMRATGWTPRVPLREGFERTIAYYRAHMPRYVEAA